MPEKALPLSIRDVAPGPGFTRLTGTRPDGLPDGVHTGGAWLDPAGREVWRALDGRPFPNATGHYPTREEGALHLMAGAPGFPTNWRIAEAGTVTQDGRTYTRRWVVRAKARRVPQEHPFAELRLEHVLETEQAVRRLNERRWEVNDALQMAFDPEGRLFILDLSATHPYPEADEEWRFYRWAESSGFDWLVALRQAAHRAVEFTTMLRDPDWPVRADGHVDTAYRHVYAAERPLADLADTYCPRAAIAQGFGPHTVRAWVIAHQPLDEETIRRHRLVWAWAPLQYENDGKSPQ